MSLADLGRGSLRRRDVGAHRQVLPHRHAAEDAARLGHQRDAAAHDLAGGEPVEALRPRTRPCPACGRTRPRIVFIVVDLPEALPPSRQTISPCSHLEVDAFQRLNRPVVGDDLVEPKHARRGVRDRLRSPPGRCALSSKPPSAILTPWSSATTRSQMPRTSLMSCSISRIGDAALTDAPDVAHQLARLGRVHAGGRLVEQQQPRLVASARAISSRRRLA